LHGQTDSHWQIMAVAEQNLLHHAMHQCGQSNLWMPCHFDLQRGGAVGAQTLRQTVGYGGGCVRRFIIRHVMFGAAETLPQALQCP